MKRVGILLNSMMCDRYIHEMAERLSASDKIELFFIMHHENSLEQESFWDKLKSRMRTRGVLRTLSLILFQIISKVEYKLLSYTSTELQAHKTLLSIETFTQHEICYITPIFSPSGISVRYSEADIAKIKALDLDLMVRGNAQGIFRGDIIHASREGILSFHHGDNRWNRGGPAGFWEVLLRKPSTGFIIQVLSEDLDGGAVIFRGEMRTRRSYSENMVHLFHNSNPYLIKIILAYADTGSLPKAETEIPFGGKLYLTPSFVASMCYLGKTIGLFASMVFNRIVLGRHPRWGVAFVHSDWQKATLRKGIAIKNPPKHFFADPFVVTRAEQTICYVEDYCYEKQKGYIAAIALTGNKGYRLLGTVIEEPFHMSFPFLFEYEGELYMVPETSESGSVRLYKCLEYPLKWEYQYDLLSDIHAFDSMIFEANGVWWLLCTVREQGKSDDSSSLYAFYSDNPISNTWKPHQMNPLIIDSQIGRNGGLLRNEAGNMVRVRQEQGFNQYGKAFSLAEIIALSPDTFHEETIAQFTPEFFEKIQGCHHLHSNGHYTVYDYMKQERLG